MRSPLSFGVSLLLLSCAGVQRVPLKSEDVRLADGRFIGPLEIPVPRRADHQGHDFEITVTLRARCAPKLVLAFPDGETQSLGQDDRRWQELLALRARGEQVNAAQPAPPPVAPSPPPPPQDGPLPYPGPSSSPGVAVDAQVVIPLPQPPAGHWETVTTESWTGQLAFERGPRRALRAGPRVPRDVPQRLRRDRHAHALGRGAAGAPRGLVELRDRRAAFHRRSRRPRRWSRTARWWSRAHLPRSRARHRPHRNVRIPRRPVTRARRGSPGSGRGKARRRVGLARGLVARAHAARAAGRGDGRCAERRLHLGVGLLDLGVARRPLGLAGRALERPASARRAARRPAQIHARRGSPASGAGAGSTSCGLRAAGASRRCAPRRRRLRRSRARSGFAAIGFSSAAAGSGRPASTKGAQRPPPPRAENPGVAPGPGAVWLQGYWRWDLARTEFVWIDGHWELPPGEGYVWVPEPQGAAGLVIRGHWELRVRP